MNRRSGPRLVVYSQDGLGLGHMRRTSLLAAEFLALSPDATTLTISDSPLGQFFAPMPGHDYMKLPSILKAGPGDWRPVSMAMPFTELLDLRRAIIRSTVLNLHPDVLLVDHMPHGAMGELLPTLEALESRPTRVVLGLRDILDAPATVRQRWAVEGALEAVEAHYDDVLVYGSQDVFDVAQQYDWPPAVSTRLRYSGYVCSPPPVRTLSSRLRSRYRRSVDGSLIVAMAGGGADADTLFDTLLSAVPRLSERRRCVVVIVTGPFLPPAERRALIRRASGLPVHVIKSVSDSMGYLGAADLVVGMAGYNTTAEILSLGQRALLIPRSGPSAEQQMRARLFAERGWVSWLPPEVLSPSTLADAMDEALSTPVTPPAIAPDLNGRTRVAQLLLRGLGADQSEPPAPAPPIESVLTEVLPAAAAPEMAEQR